MKVKAYISSIIGVLLLVVICLQIFNDFSGLLLEEDTIELSEWDDDNEEEEDLMDDHTYFYSDFDETSQKPSLSTLKIASIDLFSGYIKIPSPPPELA